jgi:hypothetical protein
VASYSLYVIHSVIQHAAPFRGAAHSTHETAQVINLSASANVSKARAVQQQQDLNTDRRFVHVDRVESIKRDACAPEAHLPPIHR